MFSPFKNALNNAINMCVGETRRKFDVFDFSGMLRFAYAEAFTRENIMLAFRRAGVWPIDRSRLLSVPRPAAQDNVTEIVSVSEVLFKKKGKI